MTGASIAARFHEYRHDIKFETYRAGVLERKQLRESLLLYPEIQQ